MKPRKPLKRSGKPIPRISKRGKARRDAWQKIKAAYFDDSDWTICQWCSDHLHRADAETHHKLKRSLGGKEGAENLVILHGRCHSIIHGDAMLYKLVRDSTANALNRGKIY